MRTAASTGQTLRPVHAQDSPPSDTPAHRSTAIRLSTRIALRGSKEQSEEDLRNLDAPDIARPMSSRRGPSPPIHVEHDYTTKTSSDILIRPQTAGPSTGGSASKGYSGNSFRKTLRKVFSLGSSEGAPEAVGRTGIMDRSDGLTLSAQWRSAPKALAQTNIETTIGQNEINKKFERPVVNPLSPRLSEDTPLTAVGKDFQQFEDNATTFPNRASRNRLRRTHSRVLRVNTAPPSDQGPSVVSFYSPTTPQSIPYLPSPQILRQLRPTHSPLHNALPPSSEPSPSQETARRSGTNSLRDSLDVQRTRYNINRGGHKDVIDTPETERNPRHRRHRSSSSMHIEVGSLKSPKQLRPAYTSSSTAPRQAMEVAGIIARLDELETRMSEVEQSLRSLKDSHNRDTELRSSKFNESSAIVAESQSFHTPPSSQHGAGVEELSFLRESSSTPLSNEPSAPSTPLGEPLGLLQADPILAENQESPHSTSRGIQSADPTLVTDRTILRESLLKQGYDHTLHHVLHAVNSEHNARIALEANVRSLSHAMSALRIVVGNTRRPHAITSPDREEAGSPNSSTTPTNVTRGEISDKEDTQAFYHAGEERKQTYGNIPPRPTSVTREPLDYSDLWSHAAVPLASPHPLALPSDQPADEDQGWTNPKQPISKFSFDNTDSTSGGSVNEGEDNSFSILLPSAISDPKREGDPEYN